MLGESLVELASVQQSRHDEAVCSTVFDCREEILWTGSSGGALHGYLCPSLDRHVVVTAHSHPVVDMLAAPEGVLSVSADAVRLHARGGRPLFWQREPAGDIQCCEWEKPGSTRVLLGHGEAAISTLDVPSATIVSQVATKQGVTVLCSNGRLIACGGAGGELTLRDVRTMRTETTLEAHLGSVTALDMKGDLLVSCGLSQRLGQVFVDPLIKVFDVRQAARALTHIPFAAGPTLVRFQPKLSSLLLVASAGGALMLTDVQAGGAVFRSFQVECEGDALLACHLSTSGESIAFGDAGGYVHLWGPPQGGSVNLQSHATDVAELGPVAPRVALSEKDPIAAAHRPMIEEAPLSLLDHKSSLRVGLPPRKVDPALLTAVTVLDFVRYVPTPRWHRGISYSQAQKFTCAMRNVRQMRQDDSLESNAIMAGSSSWMKSAPPGIARLPRGYARVEIKQVQTAKFEEFDFSYYNRTYFAGLENDTRNSYINPLLQVLYFTPPLKAAVTAHVCEREFCITCELGFVMHMLDLAEGDTCQPTNFLRALHQFGEAEALGLVHGPEAQENRYKLSAGHRIQMLSRFILDQLHKEAASSHSIAAQLFGIPVRTRSKCLRAAHDEMAQERTVFQISLQYPTAPPPPEPFTFAELLERSLAKSEDVRAWCQACRGYQPCHQTYVPSALPPVLVISCSVSSDLELTFWQTNPSPVGHQGDNDLQRSTSGIRGSDQWLPFHINIKLSDDAVSVSQVMSGLPGEASEPGRSSSDVSKDAHYMLTALVAHVQEDGDTLQDGQGGHLVAHVKIPSTYREGSFLAAAASAGRSSKFASANEGTQGGEGDEVLGSWRSSPGPGKVDSRGTVVQPGDWLLLNDFCITPTSANEVVTFYGERKVPCLVYYTLIDAEHERLVDAPPVAQSGPWCQLSDSGTNPSAILSPISDDLFCRLTAGPAPVSAMFRKLNLAEESPEPGWLLGIDAEFVAFSSPEKALRQDGAEVTRPPRLGLARVSVVRGEGPHAGMCCIDDYISTVEPVRDYLTRYSGLAPGDLDPSTSKHHITTLKNAYLKLRFLVDRGCRFVGHGLRKDFRMINIVVPPAQVVDTVELFHLKRQRKLSLRFLASYLLQLDIQKDTHDSIEDAHTALRLHEKYRQLVASGEFHDKLLEMYRHGRRTGWEVLNDMASKDAYADNVALSPI